MGQNQGGRYGEVVAASPYRVGSQDCRQYAQTVYTGGQPKTGARHRLPQCRRRLDAAHLDAVHRFFQSANRSEWCSS